MKAGYAKVCLTPPLGTELCGFAGEGRCAIGIHDNLYARVLVLDDGNGLYCLIQNDLLAIDAAFAGEIRDQLARLNIAGENIFIGATHTHSGPKGTSKSDEAFSEANRALLGDYDEELCAKYIKAIYSATAEAVERMQPYTFACGHVGTQGIAANRIDPGLDGDPVLTAIKGCGADGSKLLIYSLACHPTIMNAENLLVSADLPGGVATQLEGGEYDMVFFLNGSSGDISTRFTRKGNGFGEVQRLAALVVDSINAALSEAQPMVNSPVDICPVAVDMQVKQLDSVECAEQKLRGFEDEYQQALLSGAQELRLFASRVEGAQSNLLLSRFFHGTSNIRLEEKLVLVGGLVFVLTPGELFSALSNPLRKKYGNRVVFCSYFNGYLGYIADEASYKAQTYEALSSPYEMNQGQLLMDAVDAALAKML